MAVQGGGRAKGRDARAEPSSASLWRLPASISSKWRIFTARREARDDLEFAAQRLDEPAQGTHVPVRPTFELGDERLLGAEGRRERLLGELPGVPQPLEGHLREHLSARSWARRRWAGAIRCRSSSNRLAITLSLVPEALEVRVVTAARCWTLSSRRWLCRELRISDSSVTRQPIHLND